MRFYELKNEKNENLGRAGPAPAAGKPAPAARSWTGKIVIPAEPLPVK